MPKVVSRNAFGPILIYFGSKRLNPFKGTSRETPSLLSNELFDFDVFDNLSVLFKLPAENVQADESQ